MKKYMKPTIDILELRVNENLADIPEGEDGGLEFHETTYNWLTGGTSL